MMLSNCSGVLHVGLGDDGELARRRLDAARRDLGVLAADRVLDVLHRELVAGEPRAVEVDAHRHLALAEDAHVGRARQHGQPRLDVALHVVGGLERRLRARLDRDVDDRLRVGLDLGDDRLVDRVGQLAAHARDLVAHVGRRRIGVALSVKRTLMRLVSERLCEVISSTPSMPGERVLERLGDLRLDHLGRRAAVGRRRR